MKRETCTQVLAITMALTQLVWGQSSRTIRAAGRLEPAESHTLRSQVPQPAAVLHIAAEGTMVEKGDLLVELDDAALVEEQEELKVHLTETRARQQTAEEGLPIVKAESGVAVELAEQGLRVAELALEVYVSGEYPWQVSEAEGAVGQAEARYVEAGERLARLKESQDKPDPDRIRLAQVAKAEATWRLEAAKNRLRLLTDVTHEYSKATRQLAIAKSRFALMRAQNEAKRAVQEAEDALRIAQARLEALEHRQGVLEEAIGACKIYAPSAGTVQHVQERWGDKRAAMPLEAGCVVHRRQPLIEVMDTRRFKLVVPIDLQLVQQVEAGREVSVRVDAIANEAFTGRVADVRVVPKPGSGAAQGFLVVTVDNSAGRFRRGMTAHVEFAL